MWVAAVQQRYHLMVTSSDVGSLCTTKIPSDGNHQRYHKDTIIDDNYHPKIAVRKTDFILKLVYSFVYCRLK